MRRIALLLPVLIVLPSLITACSSTPIATPAPAPTATVVATPTPSTPTLSFVPVLYRDEINGLELDYPSDWSLDPNTQVGSRGSVALLVSPGTTDQDLPEGGSRLSITIFKWDPKNDLPAFVAHRRGAWDGGGFRILQESKLTLVDGRNASEFVVEAPDQMQAFFLFTTSGQDYLQIAGEGDMQLLAEIAHTVRPLNFK